MLAPWDFMLAEFIESHSALEYALGSSGASIRESTELWTSDDKPNMNL